MKNHDRMIILHVLDTYDEIKEFMRDAQCDSYEQFRDNPMLKRAVSMCIISVSEIVTHFSDDFRMKHPQINTRQFKSIRNVAAHNYGSVSFSKLYDTVTLELPDFVYKLGKILEKAG